MMFPAPAHRSDDARAFTLVELILVMALVVVLIAMITPSLANFFRGRMLDSEARRLLALTHSGQSRAISEGMPMLLWVNASKRTYGLEQETTARDGDPKAIAFTLDESLKLQMSAAGSVQAQGNKLPGIRFMPDGTIAETSPVSLQLIAADGSSLWLVESTNRLSYEIQSSNRER